MPIRNLSPSEAHARQRGGAVLIDVRAAHERALGMAEDALGIVREDLQADPAAYLPELDAEVVLLCQRGLRSRQVAEFLEGRGYRNLASVEGGTEVESYCDWSMIDEKWKPIFPVIDAKALKATLGILERAVLRGYPRPLAVR